MKEHDMVQPNDVLTFNCNSANLNDDKRKLALKV